MTSQPTLINQHRDILSQSHSLAVFGFNGLTQQDKGLVFKSVYSGLKRVKGLCGGFKKGDYVVLHEGSLNTAVSCVSKNERMLFTEENLT